MTVEAISGTFWRAGRSSFVPWLVAAVAAAALAFFTDVEKPARRTLR